MHNSGRFYRIQVTDLHTDSGWRVCVTVLHKVQGHWTPLDVAYGPTVWHALAKLGEGAQNRVNVGNRRLIGDL